MKRVLFVLVVSCFALAAINSGAEAPEYIKRGVFTFGIEEREPVDNVERVPTDSTRVYFFTEIVDLANTSVTHRWSYNDKTMAEVPFNVGGPRWRVYSSKKLIAAWTGTWKVEVVDADGIVMHSKTFEYHDAE